MSVLGATRPWAPNRGQLTFDGSGAENNRNQVTGYAVDLARELGGPVRMQIIDADAEWLVAVHPDGAVTEIPGDNTLKRIRLPRRPPRGSSTADLTDVATALPAHPAALISPVSRPAPVRDDLERALSRRDQREPDRLATLQFSDGSTAAVTGSALIGRRPEPEPDELVDTTVALQDYTRRLSRSHLRLEWRGSAFVAVDRHSVNGTYLRRGTNPTAELPSRIPVELINGDVLEVGTPHLTICVTLLRDEKNAG